MKRLTRFLLLLTVFLTPLIGAYGNLGFEQIKVFFFIVLITFCGFLYGGKGFKWTGISKAGVIFILILFLTSFTGINPQVSILGIQPYFQGAILYAYLFLFSLIVSWSKIKFDTWVYVLAGSATYVGILAIKDWILLNLLGHQIPNYAGRVVSTFGQPNFYAGFLLLTLPFCYKLGRFGLLGGLVSAVGILVSYSRSAIILLFLLMIWALLNQIGIKFKVILGLFILTVIIFLGAASISLEAKSGAVWREFIKPSDNQWLIDNSPEKRIFIWPVIGKLIIEKPLQGYGLENMQTVFSGFFKEINFNTNSVPVYYSLKDLSVDRSHNYILDLLLFSGILGLLGWLALVILLFKKILQSEITLKNTILLLSLTLYLIWIQFQNQSMVQLLYFWLLVGIVDQI